MKTIRKKVSRGIYILCVCACVAGCARSNYPFLSVEDEGLRGAYTKKFDADVVYARELKDEDLESLQGYRIEIEDVVDISVWQIEDLSRRVSVRPDGKISFPLIGDTAAAGLTADELRAELEKALELYIRNPRVSVIVSEFGGKKAVVIDEARGGGVIRFTTPIRIMEALALTGGYSSNLNLKKIYVIRKGAAKDEQNKIIVVNAQKVLREGDMDENILVRSDDIIFLARGALSSISNFVSQIKAVSDGAQQAMTMADYYWNFHQYTPYYKVNLGEYSGVRGTQGQRR